MLPEAVFHACRHLDEAEGPVHAGRVLQPADRAAINSVLDYLAELNRQDAELRRTQSREPAVTLGGVGPGLRASHRYNPDEGLSLSPQRKLTREEAGALLEEWDDPSLRAPLYASYEWHAAFARAARWLRRGVGTSSPATSSGEGDRAPHLGTAGVARVRVMGPDGRVVDATPTRGAWEVVTWSEGSYHVWPVLADSDH